MSDTSRRKLLKSIATGSGAIVAGKSLPESWAKPVVDSVMLPVHAQTSEDEPVLYAIGDTGPCGGIVFYISNGGLNGLESSTVDQGGTVQWGCMGTAIPNARGLAIGDGAANTAAILIGCNVRPIAAERASDYTVGGCTGWFLPSRDELNEMYTQLHVSGLGGFSNANYWSSSEGSRNTAWFQTFTTSGFGAGDQGGGNKINTLRVRAVRGF